MSIDQRQMLELVAKVAAIISEVEDHLFGEGTRSPDDANKEFLRWHITKLVETVAALERCLFGIDGAKSSVADPDGGRAGVRAMKLDFEDSVREQLLVEAVHDDTVRQVFRHTLEMARTVEKYLDEYLAWRAAEAVAPEDRPHVPFLEAFDDPANKSWLGGGDQP